VQRPKKKFDNLSPKEFLPGNEVLPGDQRLSIVSIRRFVHHSYPSSLRRAEVNQRREKIF
jgi:hypothetical protein